MGPIARIIHEEAARAGVRVADLLSPARNLHYVRPRHKAMYRARHEVGASFLKISRIFNRDHTTCIYAVKKLEREHAARA